MEMVEIEEKKEEKDLDMEEEEGEADVDRSDTVVDDNRMVSPDKK
jgi:hypothetical protein